MASAGKATGSKAAAGGGAAAGKASAPGLEARVLVVGRNPRGIPAMRFIEDVAKFLQDNRTSVEALIQGLNEMHSKYQLLEKSHVSNRAQLKTKIPEIKRSLEMVRLLRKKQTDGEVLKTSFNLSDTVFTEAQVEPRGTVCLWMGANVMLEHSYEEAEALLVENLAAAEQKEAEYSDDLQFIKDQAITTQVNMSRTFNHDVLQRRQARQGGAAAASPAAAADGDDDDGKVAE